VQHKNSYSTAKTVQKAFNLLEFLGEKQPARPSELVQQLKLTRSNVHRLLSTLERIGYVEKSDDSRYRLSFKVFMLGSNIVKGNRLSNVAHPFMFRLAESTQENVNLAIMYEQKVLYIKKIESPHYLKLDQPIGKTDPLHCTALGKVLLSGLTDEELESFCRSSKLSSYTKNTITDPKTLIEVIQDVRKKGYAIDLQEVLEGVHCISAPVRDHTSKVIAAVSISSPAFRLTKEKLNKMKVPLIETCSEISKKMGYMPS
jgi:DNA-binding IclR family transcriptional regulator